MSSSQTRHVYTGEQRAILETSFARQSHPDINEKERLAKLFNCNLIQISNWFQNHRRRIKKQQKIISSNTPYVYHPAEYSSYYYPPPDFYPQQSYDPFVNYYTQ